MSAQDNNDQSWVHGFDPEQQQGHESHEDAEPAAGATEMAEDLTVPPRKQKAKSVKAAGGDKKQTMIIIGVAAVAAVGWIGYGMIEKPAVPAGKAPLALVSQLLPPARPAGPQRIGMATASLPVPARTVALETAQRRTAPPLVQRAIPPVNTTPLMPSAGPASATAAPATIPAMAMNAGGLPLPAASSASGAIRFAGAGGTFSAADEVASSALQTASPAATASAISTGAIVALNNQIAKLKNRIAQESLQLNAEKTANASAQAPKKQQTKVVYRVIYRDVPTARRTATAKPLVAAHRVPHQEAPAINGIRVIGASSGTAWLSVQGHHMMAQVGDAVPGLGIVQSISDNGVVRGSHGTARP